MRGSFKAVAVVGLLLESAAWGFDLQQFAPAVDPQGYFSVYSSQTAPKRRFYIGVWDNYAYVDPVDGLNTTDVVGSYSITDQIELGIDIPLSYVDSAPPGFDDGFDIDDIKLNAKIHVFDRGRFGLAVVPFVELPTGNDSHLTSNGKTNGGFLTVADYTMDRFRVAGNAGYKVNGHSGESDEVPFGLGVGYLLIGEQPILGADKPRLELLGEVFGSTAENDFFKRELTTPIEFLVGGRYYLPSGFQFVLGAGRRIVDGVNGPDYRIVGSVGYYWQPKETPAPPPPPAAAAPLPPPSKVVISEEQIIPLEPIYFDYDKATIKPVSMQILDQVVMVMKDRPGIRVRVEGHTDSKGTEAYNQKLSQRRADAVVEYLAKKGVDRSRLEPAGFGPTRPIAPNANPDGKDNPIGRAKNRRTEFHVIGGR